MSVFSPFMDLGYDLLDGFSSGGRVGPPSEPLFTGAGLIHVGDSSTFFYSDPTCRLAGGNPNWYAGKTVAAGDCCGNGQSAAETDWAINATDATKLSSASIAYTSPDNLGGTIDITGGVGFTHQTVWIISVDNTTHEVQCAASPDHWTLLGATPVSFGTPGATAGVALWNRQQTVSYYRARSPGGVTGHLGGPSGGGTGIVDGTVIWDWIEDLATSARIGPTPSFIGGNTLISPNNKFVAGINAGEKAARIGYYDTGLAYATSTSYNVGDGVITAAGNAYVALKAGTTASSGTGPSSTVPVVGIADGTVIWQFTGTSGQNGGDQGLCNFTPPAAGAVINWRATVTFTGDPTDARFKANGGPRFKGFRLPSADMTGGGAPQWCFTNPGVYAPPVTSWISVMQYVAQGFTDSFSAYPVGHDQGTNPLGPYLVDTSAAGPPLMSVTPTAHRFTISFKSSTVAGAKDGWARLWIDGVLVMDVSQRGLGVTPPGGEKQFTGSDELTFSEFVNTVLDSGLTFTFQHGGVMSGTHQAPFTMDVNIGDGNPATSTTWLAWSA